jgi:hypothetical protein
MATADNAIRQLVVKSGGVTKFARRVWPDDDPRKHKGKVHRWYMGTSAPNASASKAIAAAFGVSTDQVLGTPQVRSYSGQRELQTRLTRIFQTQRQSEAEKVVRRFEADYARFLRDLEKLGVIREGRHGKA